MNRQSEELKTGYFQNLRIETRNLITTDPHTRKCDTKHTSGKGRGLQVDKEGNGQSKERKTEKFEIYASRRVI